MPISSVQGGKGLITVNLVSKRFSALNSSFFIDCITMFAKESLTQWRYNGYYGLPVSHCKSDSFSEFFDNLHILNKSDVSEYFFLNL